MQQSENTNLICTSLMCCVRGRDHTHAFAIANSSLCSRPRTQFVRHDEHNVVFAIANRRYVFATANTTLHSSFRTNCVRGHERKDAIAIANACICSCTQTQNLCLGECVYHVSRRVPSHDVAGITRQHTVQYIPCQSFLASSHGCFIPRRALSARCIKFDASVSLRQET